MRVFQRNLDGASSSVSELCEQLFPRPASAQSEPQELADTAEVPGGGGGCREIQEPPAEVGDMMFEGESERGRVEGMSDGERVEEREKLNRDMAESR